jgi:simple sugar transport system permease protein
MPELNFITDLLAASIQAGTPLLLACLGEIITERSGNLNLGAEGMMLVGAMTGFATAYFTGSPVLGAIAGSLAGCGMSLIHAFLTVSLQASQVVSGLGITIFGIGLSGFLGVGLVGLKGPGFAKISIPFLSDIPIIGQVFFNQDALVYVALLLVPLTWYYLFRSRPGLSVRAAGENPSAADAWGESVATIRYIHVLMGGFLAGLAGAYLSLGYTHMWMENMVAGRGWIAVALVIFGFWHPFKAAAGAFLFGGVGVLQLRVQAAGVHIPSSLLVMLPYLLTVGVLILITLRQRRSGSVDAPAALGLPFRRGE